MIIAHSECVFVVLLIQHAKYMHSCNLWPLSFYLIFTKL